MGRRYFGASHSRRPSERTATLPTPPSQRAANHIRRCVSGRGSCCLGFLSGFLSAGINDPLASMIAALGPDLAAENPIGPRGIAENERDQHGDAEQHEDLAALRRSEE